MLNAMALKNKNGQVAETSTWIFATLIILVVVLISIFVASIVGSFGNKNAVPYGGFDLFAKKSLAAFLATPEGSGTVYGQINSQGNLDSFNGNLAKGIFKNLYGGFYSTGVYLGVYDPASFITLEKNSYFGTRPSLTVKTEFGQVLNVDGFEDYINLSNGKVLHLILAGGYS